MIRTLPAFFSDAVEDRPFLSIAILGDGKPLMFNRFHQKGDEPNLQTHHLQVSCQTFGGVKNNSKTIMFQAFFCGGKLSPTFKTTTLKTGLTT